MNNGIELPENDIEEEIKIVNEIFQYNLKILRTSEGLNGTQMASRLDLPVKRVNDLEEGRMPPNLRDLIKIVDYFPIDFNCLLDSKIQLLTSNSKIRRSR